jgi:hypothetical protein
MEPNEFFSEGERKGMNWALVVLGAITLLVIVIPLLLVFTDLF